MASARTALIERGRKRAQLQRPGRFVYGASINVPCSISNRTFDQQMSPDGGFLSFETMQVHIIRSDLPESYEFKKGYECTVTDSDSGDQHNLFIGDDNSSQAGLVILNLSTLPG